MKLFVRLIMLALVAASMSACFSVYEKTCAKGSDGVERCHTQVLGF